MARTEPEPHDAELIAIRRVFDALIPLPTTARWRALRYVWAYLEETQRKAEEEQVRKSAGTVEEAIRVLQERINDHGYTKEIRAALESERE